MKTYANKSDIINTSQAIAVMAVTIRIINAQTLSFCCRFGDLITAAILTKGDNIKPLHNREPLSAFHVEHSGEELSSVQLWQNQVHRLRVIHTSPLCANAAATIVVNAAQAMVNKCKTNADEQKSGSHRERWRDGDS